jgi:methionyl-tRNA formyltransferase
MKIAFFGTPQFAVPSLTRLLADPNHDLRAVVTQPDKRRGRGNQLTPSPVKALALKHDLPVWDPVRIKREPEVIAALKALECDVFIVIAYGQILSQEILDLPSVGCINAHGSILPPYRGAAPIQWCLYHGETETGVTTMLMDAGMDTGAMLLDARTPIWAEDNAQTLGDRLAHISAELLVTTLAQITTPGIQPRPQDEALATYAPLIQKADYALNWQRSALELHNQVRGFSPNAACQFRGEPLKVLETIPLGFPDLAWGESMHTEVQETEEAWHVLPQNPMQPGQVLGILKNRGPVVATAQGALLLRQVKPAGKKGMSGWDFANGLRVEVGEQLSL